jgi:hypothetical protein
LIGGGIALAAPASDTKGVLVSKASPAIVVPHAALTLPPVPAGAGTQDTPALVLPSGTLPGSSTPVALDSMGIPVRALDGYRKAASLVGAADPTCHIDWALLAAIGRVESDHGRYGGSQLDSAGVDQPGIFGVPLNGLNGTALITDTGGNVLDGSGGFARAEGPMQFIPSTWRLVGVDANGDGVKNPQDMADASATTAVYLCSGGGDLTRAGDLRAAILRYNPSDSYVQTVTAIADAYRHGVSALPASDLPAANSALPQAGTTAATTRSANAVNSKPASHPTPSTKRQPAAGAPTTTAPTTAPTPAPSPSGTPAVPAPLPALPAPSPTLPAPPSPSLTQVCAINPLGVKICTIAARG